MDEVFTSYRNTIPGTLLNCWQRNVRSFSNTTRIEHPGPSWGEWINSPRRKIQRRSQKSNKRVIEWETTRTMSQAVSYIRFPIFIRLNYKQVKY